MIMHSIDEAKLTQLETQSQRIQPLTGVQPPPGHSLIIPWFPGSAPAPACGFARIIRPDQLAAQRTALRAVCEGDHNLTGEPMLGSTATARRYARQLGAFLDELVEQRQALLLFRA